MDKQKTYVIVATTLLIASALFAQPQTKERKGENLLEQSITLENKTDFDLFGEKKKAKGPKNVTGAEISEAPVKLEKGQTGQLKFTIPENTASAQKDYKKTTVAEFKLEYGLWVREGQADKPLCKFEIEAKRKTVPPAKEAGESAPTTAAVEDKISCSAKKKKGQQCRCAVLEQGESTVIQITTGSKFDAKTMSAPEDVRTWE